MPTETVAAALPPPVVQPAIDVDRLLNGMGAGCRKLLARDAYPRASQMRGWEGEVRLRCAWRAKGHYWPFRWKTVRWFEVLDQHALALVEQLRRFASLPENRSRRSQVVVPVSYRLKGPT